MTQEEKDLLLKDLCARLPHGVKLNMKGLIGVSHHTTILYGKNTEIYFRYSCNDYFINEVKPYLFPLSSMTEEQYESLRESGILSNCSHSYEYVNSHIYGVSFIFKEFKTYSLELIEWLNKNHFDYRGLIEKGLAINAAGLNIY